MKLYEATDALRIGDEWLEEAGGELTPELEALLDSAEGTFSDKVERVALKVRAFEAEAKAIKEERDRLQARVMARENAAKSLKAYLQRCMEAAGKDKVNGLLVTVAVQQNPPSVQVGPMVDELELYEAGCPYVERVPERFVLDKRTLLEDYKAMGERVLPSGITVTRSTSLRIR